MAECDVSKYGPVFAELIDAAELPPLDGGTNHAASNPDVRALTTDSAFPGSGLADREMAEACVSGALLLYGDLDRSHRISQGIDTPTGSFWHGIMHRREGDFRNAKHWFRRTGKHPAFEDVAKAAADTIDSAGGDSRFAKLRAGEDWDPFAFVDLSASEVGSGSEAESLCREIQMAEWRVLFDYSYRRAIERA